MTNTPAELRASRWHQRPKRLASFGHSFILSISFFQHLSKIGCPADLMKPAFLWIRKSVLPPYNFPLLLTPVVSDLTLLPVSPSALPHHSTSSFFLSPHPSCSAKSACIWAVLELHLVLPGWWQKLGSLSETQTLFLTLHREFDCLWDLHPWGLLLRCWNKMLNKTQLEWNIDLTDTVHQTQRKFRLKKRIWMWGNTSKWLYVGKKSNGLCTVLSKCTSSESQLAAISHCTMSSLERLVSLCHAMVLLQLQTPSFFLVDNICISLILAP